MRYAYNAAYMARISVYLSDELHRQAKRARLNVSELTQQAIRDALARSARIKGLQDFLDADASRQRTVSADEIAAADAWAAEIVAAARRGRDAQRRSRDHRAKRSA